MPPLLSFRIVIVLRIEDHYPKPEALNSLLFSAFVGRGMEENEEPFEIIKYQAQVHDKRPRGEGSLNPLKVNQ